MMKKVLLTLMLCTLGLGMVGCGEKKEESKGKESKLEETKKDEKKFVAFVTDVASIDDKSFNEGSWKGVLKFTDKSGYKREFFRPADDTQEARREAIDKAVKAGADVLLLIGSLFEEVVCEKQFQYKDVEILYVDAEPKDKDGNIKYSKNTSSILFKDEEVGYLAGYAAVKEGYKKLGFLGGMDIPAVRRFGYGYVQGAEAAAKDLKIKDIKIEYKYTGVFSPSDEITKEVEKWYESGTEIVFSCGGGILYSVIEAAGDHKDRKIIGVDVDQSAESEQIVFSAMKGLTNSICSALEIYDENGYKWPKERAGKKVHLGVKEDGVGLSATKGSWRMKNMSIKDYEKMIDKMREKDLNISKESLPELNHVKLNKIN